MVFAKNEGSGKWMPLSEDSEAVTQVGEVRWRVSDGDGGPWAVRAQPGEDGMLSHFSDCPEADSFRRGARR